jgi:hypothetical protein
MKYVVPIQGAEHLFDYSDEGLARAKELAIAGHATVYIESGGKRAEPVFPIGETIQVRSGFPLDKQ